MINRAFILGIFPEKFKVAVITPVYKSKGNKSSVENYRPISVLPTLSKIFERCIETRMSNFFYNFGIISDVQYGFTTGLSTEHAILKFCETIYSGYNLNEFMIAIFIDFQRVFDTVNLDILIRKLEAYGIRGNASRLVRSFLTNRKKLC